VCVCTCVDVLFGLWGLGWFVCMFFPWHIKTVLSFLEHLEMFPFINNFSIVVPVMVSFTVVQVNLCDLQSAHSL